MAPVFRRASIPVILYFLPGMVLHLLFWIYTIQHFDFAGGIRLKYHETFQPAQRKDPAPRPDAEQPRSSQQGIRTPIMRYKHDRSHTWLHRFVQSSPKNIPGPEFMGLYIAARQLVTGKSIYDRQPVSFPNNPEILVTTSNYPVTCIVLMTPFLFLSPWAAYLAWLVLHEVTLVILIVLTLIFLRGYAWRWVFAGAWLYAGAYYEDMFLGQTSIFMALLILLCGLAIIKADRRMLMLSWTTAIWIKIFPVLWLPVMARCLRPKQVVTVLLLFAIPIMGYFAMHPGDLAFFFQRMTGIVRPGDSPFPEQQQVMTSAAGGEGLQRLIWNWSRSKLLVRTLSISIMGSALLLSLFAASASPLAVIALLINAHFLAFPFVWYHHYLMLLPVCFFAYRVFKTRWIAALMFFVVISPPKWVVPAFASNWALWWLIPTTILFVMLFMHVLNAGCRRRNRDI